MIQDKLENHSITARGILATKEAYKNSQVDDFDKKVFIGNLNRYTIEEKYCYIKYDDNLKEKPRSYDFFLGERILVRRIISRQFRIMANIVNDEFVCKKDIYIVKLTDSSIDYKFILGLLNSKLISYYKTKNSGSAKKDDFTQITLGDIRQLPIPKSTRKGREKISDLVRKILDNKKEDLKADTIILENQIDQLVYQLYDLTEEEIAIVENDGK